MGIKKHLAPVPEPLIERTLRQIGGSPLIVSDSSDFDYLPVKRVKPINPGYGNIDKILSAKKHWNPNGKTLLILGDVYFTDEAIRTILDHNEKDWFQYGRLHRNRFTEKRYNENFALSFYPEHHESIIKAGKRSCELLQSKLIPRNCMAQWYRIMCGKDGKNAHTGGRQENLGNFVEINDLTDDIDKPEDYERLMTLI